MSFRQTINLSLLTIFNLSHSLVQFFRSVNLNIPPPLSFPFKIIQLRFQLLLLTPLIGQIQLHPLFPLQDPIQLLDLLSQLQILPLKLLTITLQRSLRPQLLLKFLDPCPEQIMSLITSILIQHQPILILQGPL